MARRFSILMLVLGAAFAIYSGAFRKTTNLATSGFYNESGSRLVKLSAGAVVPPGLEKMLAISSSRRLGNGQCAKKKPQNVVERIQEWLTPQSVYALDCGLGSGCYGAYYRAELYNCGSECDPRNHDLVYARLYADPLLAGVCRGKMQPGTQTCSGCQICRETGCQVDFCSPDADL